MDTFQSRAGFSECLDSIGEQRAMGRTGFNPVLGFLSVSTGDQSGGVAAYSGFNPVLGFLSVST